MEVLLVPLISLLFFIFPIIVCLPFLIVVLGHKFNVLERLLPFLIVVLGHTFIVWIVSIRLLLIVPPLVAPEPMTADLHKGTQFFLADFLLLSNCLPLRRRQALLLVVVVFQSPPCPFIMAERSPLSNMMNKDVLFSEQIDSLKKLLMKNLAASLTKCACWSCRCQ